VQVRRGLRAAKVPRQRVLSGASRIRLIRRLGSDALRVAASRSHEHRTVLSAAPGTLMSTLASPHARHPTSGSVRAPRGRAGSFAATDRQQERWKGLQKAAAALPSPFSAPSVAGAVAPCGPMNGRALPGSGACPPSAKGTFRSRTGPAMTRDEPAAPRVLMPLKGRLPGALPGEHGLDVIDDDLLLVELAVSAGFGAVFAACFSHPRHGQADVNRAAAEWRRAPFGRACHGRRARGAA
jgi:hypothetical protein